MKNIFLSLILILASFQLKAQTLKTTFHNSWDRWQLNGKTFQTVFANDYGNWECGSTSIKLTFSNDWSRWTVGNSTTLNVVFFDAYDQWEIKSGDQTVQVKTTFNDDFERWEISGDAEGTMRTVFSKSYDQWNIDVDFGQLPQEMRDAIVFVAIYTSFSGKL